jgi:uncharacterized membrane protein YqiK
MKLKSIEEEAADCRKAFKGFPIGGYTLHCHHGCVGEILTEEAENRITYILTQKPESERALRLRLFRPVFKEKLEADAEGQKAYAEWQKANAERQKAYAERQKADAECQKAYAERRKADAEWQKADAERRKADAEGQKANVALGVLIHAHFCAPDCPWDGKTIFSEEA